MHLQSSLAARRFYCAFYRWTRPHSQLAISTATRRAGLNTTRGARVRRFNSTSKRTDDKYEPLQDDNDAEKTGYSVAAVSGRDRYQTWRDAPVESVERRPFHTLEPDSFAIRYRSPSSLMIECAVPSDRFSSIQTQYGTLLDKISIKYGSVIRVQDISAPAPAHAGGAANLSIVSVLISGTFEQVHDTYHVIRSSTSSPVFTPPASTKVFSMLARPSQTLPPGTSVFRSKNPACLELSISEQHFMELVATNDVEASTKKLELEVEIGEPEQRPSSHDSSKTLMARSLRFTGSYRRILNAKTWVLGISKNASSTELSSSTARQYPKKKEPTSATSPQVKEEDTARGNGSAQPEQRALQGIVFKLPYEFDELIQPNLESVRARFANAFGKDTQVKCPHLTTNRARKRVLVVVPSDNVAAASQLLKEIVEEICAKLGKTAGWIREIARYTSLPPSRERMQKLEASPKPQELEVSPKPTKPERLVCRAQIFGSDTEKVASHVASADMLVALNSGPDIKPRKDAFIKQKAAGLLVLTGSSVQVTRFQELLPERIRSVCAEMGWSDHQVSFEVRPMDRELYVAGLKEDLKRSFRGLTYPVAVVTAQGPIPPSDKTPAPSPYDGYKGLTVSSFTTVTMDPDPVVSFNVKLPSRTWNAISKSKECRVHFLSGNSRGALLANAFTKGNENSAEVFEALSQELDISISQAVSKKHAPRFKDDAGHSIMFDLYLRLIPEKCIKVRDHMIVVASVREINVHDAGVDRAPCLTYSMQRYQGSEGVIELAETLGQGTQGQDADTSETVESDDLHGDLDPLLLGADAERQPGPQISSLSKLDKTRNSAETSEADDFKISDDHLFATLEKTREKIEDDHDNFYADWDSRGHVEVAPRNANEPASPKPLQQENDDHDSNGAAGNGSGQPRSVRMSSVSSPGGISQTRSYSVYARPLNIFRSWQHSGYHSGIPRKDSADISSIVDTAHMETTVSDYLSCRNNTVDSRGIYRPYVKQISVKGAINLQAANQKLRALLPTASDEDAEAISAEIAMNERVISKKLAINAAFKLRDMLDKGRYEVMFWKQVPYLEGCIERGQVALLEQVKALRARMSEGMTTNETFEEEKAEIEKLNLMFTTETNRLREIVNEDGVDGSQRIDDDDD